MEFTYKNLAWLIQESSDYREYDNKNIPVPEPLKTFLKDLSQEYHTNLNVLATISILLLKYWIEENYMDINRERIKEELKEEIKQELKEKTLKELQEDIERDVDENISPKIGKKVENIITDKIIKTLTK